MSDLIEKLEVLFRDPEGLYPVAISREEHQQILSALKTVRGIEEARKGDIEATNAEWERRDFH